MAQIGEGSLELRNPKQKFISKVIPDYLADFDNLNEESTATIQLSQDLNPRILLVWDLCLWLS